MRRLRARDRLFALRAARLGARQDRAWASSRARSASSSCEAEKKREENHPPLRIEPPVAEIKKSERVQKEKQAPLFEELPDTPLPPLKLLDEAKPEGEQVSAETLEFTSRLIEKKLSDFGVAVKVLAAYPGPVITRYEIEPAVGVKGSQIVNLVKDLARALSVVSHPRGRDHPGQVVHGPRDPEPAPPDRAPVRDPRLAGLPRAQLAARARARQGHRRQPGGRRPRAHAAPAGRRHHRLGQVGGAQRDDPRRSSTRPSRATCA